MASSFHTMEAQALTRQAHQAGEKIKQDVPAQFKPELKRILDELTGRVDEVPHSRERHSSRPAAGSSRACRARCLTSRSRCALPAAWRARSPPRPGRHGRAQPETPAHLWGMSQFPQVGYSLRCPS